MAIVRNVISGPEARTRLIEGVDILANAVKSTLGARGQTVLIESDNHTRGVTITKDGVTVAKSINLEEPVRNLAVQILKEASEKTATLAGDGPQPLYAKVLTPSGFVNMHTLRVGDTILDTNGGSQSVLGVFPKGDLEIYEVELADGRVVECSGNHLWTVVRQTNGGKVVTMTTEEMMRDYKRTTKRGHNVFKYFIPVPTIDFKHDMYKSMRTIDPMLLGMLLGDGSLSGTGSIELSLGINKAGLLDRIKTPEGISFNSRLCEDKNYYRVKFVGQTKDGKYMRDLLDDMGLLGTKSSSKFIPESYLFAPKEVREALFTGLTVTDGYINSRGLVEFSTISDTLARDYKRLLLSLGFSYGYKLHKRDNDAGSYSKTPIHRISALVGYKNGYKIVGIKPTGKTTPMMCIKVSSDNSLYLTDNMVPTHNTTTSMVLAQAMIHAFETYKKEGQNDTQVLREVKQIVDSVIEMLSSRAIPVTDETLLDVATISANGDTTLGAIIAEAYQKVGPSGVVTVQHSSTSSTYSEVVSGMKLQRGWMSKYFVSDQKKQEAVLEDCYILVSDQEITNLAHIEHLLVPVLNSNKSLLIISELSENALNTLTVNKLKGTIKVCAIVPPQFGSRRAEIMEDIAAATGGVYISDSTGDDLSHIGFNNLGHAERVIVSSDSTVIFTKEVNERCSDRISQIRDKMSVEKDEVAKRQLEERMANLAGGVGVIYVGAQSDIEMKEKLDRVDDAVYAVRAALEGGILPGGGIALRDIAVRMCGCSTAKSIVKSAILGPFEAILTNGGYDVYDIASQIAVEAYDESNPAVPKLGYGYDVKAEVVGNMIEMGIIDPLKVTKSALENAVSVATTILSTNVVVYNERA